MTGRTYDPAPLFAVAERQGLNMSEMAERIGCHRSLLARWRREGGVPDRWADAAAVAVGRLPGELWPEWEANGLADLETEDARRRARDAAKKRRYRQRHAHVRERERAARRAAYEHGREYETARQRRYYAANAEREKARVREYERRMRTEREAS